jgi:sodium transport system permease protein
LTGEGIDTDKAFNQITVATEELESESDYMINILISFSMTFTLMSAIYASVYGATDVVAGEKERGTLETMVTFPVSNVDIMAGKFLGILCSSIIVAVFALLLTYGSFFISGLLFSVYDKVNLNITLSGLLLTMLTILSGCVISSGVCIALASYCNNYKEAQETTGFITMFSIIPMFIEMMKVEAAWWIYLIPLCGQGIMLDKILYNEFNLTNFIILISSSVIISILLIVFNAKRYKSEKAIFG